MLKVTTPDGRSRRLLIAGVSHLVDLRLWRPSTLSKAANDCIRLKYCQYGPLPLCCIWCNALDVPGCNYEWYLMIW